MIDNSYKCHVADLGLYKPVDEENEKIIYGVLPYVAPEVLRGKIYTRAADIYSFGILAKYFLNYHRFIMMNLLLQKYVKASDQNLILKYHPY